MQLCKYNFYFLSVRLETQIFSRGFMYRRLVQFQISEIKLKTWFYSVCQTNQMTIKFLEGFESKTDGFTFYSKFYFFPSNYHCWVDAVKFIRKKIYMYFPSFSYSVNVFLSLCFLLFSLSKCFYALKIEILLLILYTGKQHIPITFCPKWLETAQPMRQILILNPERKEIQRMWELGTDYHWFINQWEREAESSQ